MNDKSRPETIFALSSGRGRAGVAVIRVSGPAAVAGLQALGAPCPAARVATICRLEDPQDGELLDEALILYFPAPASFTGEDVVELHVHGGHAVIGAFLEALGRIEGLRGARPGEFARRAFQNDKFDLTQAEGLADLISAETDAQRRQALQQAGGTLRTMCEKWRGQIIHAASLVEAALDFSDEADVPALIETQARPVVEELMASISSHLGDARKGERLRDGLQVVLAGAPNAGKSSLLNALSRRDAAIVSDEPGTTRDVIEVHLDLGGYPVILIDTAGVREAGSDVEAEGIRRTQARAEAADLVLWLVDATQPCWKPPAGLLCDGQAARVLLNKTDLASPQPPRETGFLPISAKTGLGLDELLGELTRAAEALIKAGEPAVVTRARQRQELEACAGALKEFLSGDASALELRAEDLRVAGSALGRLTGRIDVEDVLDRIFGDFCIGK